MMQSYVLFCLTLYYIDVLLTFTAEVQWTEKEASLAAWAFRKWKYHQFTSLRVCNSYCAHM